MKNIFTAVLLSALFLAGCGGGNTREAKEKELAKLNKERDALTAKITAIETELGKDTIERPNGREVTTLAVSEKHFKHFIDIQGTVTSDENVSVTTDMGGTVMQILVKEGDRVSKGQTLVVLDDDIIRKQLEELQVSLNLAKTVYEKQKALWDQKIGSELQYLQAKNNYEGLQGRVASAQAQQNRTRIKSPINGTVDNIDVNIGELASPGRQILRVVNLSDLKVVADAAENYIGSVSQGDSADITFPAIGLTRKAKVTYVGQVINSTNRTFPIEIRLGNKENTLKANLLAVIQVIDYESKKALVVPTRYVIELGKDYIVYISDVDSTGSAVARRQIVKTGKSYNGETEILEGLKLGDIIIAEGSRDVSNGEDIKVIETNK
ncbi:efflux RND transporter periplasmic adaptor subunit [soil metagenome]